AGWRSGPRARRQCAARARLVWLFAGSGVVFGAGLAAVALAPTRHYRSRRHAQPLPARRVMRTQFLSDPTQGVTAMASMISGTVIQGHVEDGWGKVADAFRANFETGVGPGEVGAAVAVYVDGRPVVDLWGGLADRAANRPWSNDTIALVASTTK